MAGSENTGGISRKPLRRAGGNVSTSTVAEARSTASKAAPYPSSTSSAVGLRDITNVASAGALPSAKSTKRPFSGSHEHAPSSVSVPAWAAPGPETAVKPPMPPPPPAAALPVFPGATGLSEPNYVSQDAFAGLAAFADPIAARLSVRCTSCGERCSPTADSGLCSACISNTEARPANQAVFSGAIQQAGVYAPVAARDVTMRLSDHNVAESSEQMVAEYAPVIFDRLFASEQEGFRPDPGYIRNQVEVNGKMRAILVDWLVEVHLKYKLRTETLFLSVSLIDRFLARVQVQRKKLQLVGVVAMCVASKFEDIAPPQVSDFVYITDNAYTQDEIRRAEVVMLTELSFNVVVPTPAHFVERLLRANGSDGVHTELVGYLLELALLDLHMIRHAASLLSAAAVLLANGLLRRAPSWPTALAHLARYSEFELQECVEELLAIFEAAPSSSLQAIRKKYAQPRRLSISRMEFATLR